MKKKKDKRIRILVLGSDGMLGYDVVEHFHSQRDVYETIGTEMVDMKEWWCKRGLLDKVLETAKADVVINCVAFTDVRAEEHELAGDPNALGYKLNVAFPKALAEICKNLRTKLIHISTDYVFSECSTMTGKSLLDPEKPAYGFTEDDTPAPCCRYGMHKFLGEAEVMLATAAGIYEEVAILRTSWLIGAHNEKSVAHKMLRKLAAASANCSNREDGCKFKVAQIRALKDVWSVPTTTWYVCDCLQRVIEEDLVGVFHAVPRAKGPVSAAKMARKITEFFNTRIKPQAGEVPGDVLEWESSSDDFWLPKMTCMQVSTEFLGLGTWEERLEEMFFEDDENKFIEFTDRVIEEAILAEDEARSKKRKEMKHEETTVGELK